MEVSHVKTATAALSDYCTSENCTLNDEQQWRDLYTWLLPLVEMWVYYADVPSWLGQQKEVAEDITQEALFRMFRYSQRAERGEVSTITSLRSLSRTIAQNHFRDRRKKERCIVHPNPDTLQLETAILAGEQIDPSQIAVDRMMLSTVIIAAARTVKKFPLRQRAALLTDLANTADFGEQPGLLEQALSEEGISLRDYSHPISQEQGERNRHAALLCIAYKRLRKEIEV
jgi:DNA-directed RNA polymerase specialized sigma24 family protein